MLRYNYKEIIKIPNPFLKVVAKPVIDINENILSIPGGAALHKILYL
jgi:hypothetical protein